MQTSQPGAHTPEPAPSSAGGTAPGTCRRSRRGVLSRSPGAPGTRSLANGLLVFLTGLALILTGSPHLLADTPDLPGYLLEVPTGIKALPDHTKQVQVPLQFRHDGRGPFEVLRIGLDYEELLLQYAGSDIEIEGAAGLDVETLYHDPDSGRVDLEVIFDPFRGIDEKVPLVNLLFTVTTFRALDAEEYELQKNAQVKILPEHTYFVDLDKRQEGPESQPVSLETRDGSVTILLSDHLEIRSASITPDAQRFSLPVRVTHLGREASRFTMGFHYPRPELALVDVSGRPGQGITAVEWNDQYEEGGVRMPGTITVTFDGGIFPVMKDTRLLDLHFAFTPVAPVTTSDLLYVEPFWTSSESLLDEPWDPDQFALNDGLDEEVPVTDGIIRVLPRTFIRGDANLSSSVEVEDALTILKATFYSGLVSLHCQEAADSNDDGRVGISDSVHLLTYLYGGGAPPSFPFPAPGPDPDLHGSLGCDVYGVPSVELAEW